MFFQINFNNSNAKENPQQILKEYKSCGGNKPSCNTLAQAI